MYPRLVQALEAATGFTHWELILPGFAQLMALGFGAGTALALPTLRAEGFDRRTIGTACLLGWGCGLLGARAFSLLQNLPRWLAEPGHWHLLTHGGLVAYGGYLGGVAGALLYLRRRLTTRDTLRFLDAAAPFIGVGTFFGRLGCFAGGCDYGMVSSVPWAVRFPKGSAAWEAHLEAGVIHSENFLSAPVHPTQLYSALYGLGLFLVFRTLVWPRRRFPGQVVLLYALAYAICRFFVELLRGDVDRGFVGPLSTSQAVGVLVAAAALVLLGRLRRESAPPAPAPAP